MSALGMAYSALSPTTAAPSPPPMLTKKRSGGIILVDTTGVNGVNIAAAEGWSGGRPLSVVAGKVGRGAVEFPTSYVLLLERGRPLSAFVFISGSLDAPQRKA